MPESRALNRYRVVAAAVFIVAALAVLPSCGPTDPNRPLTADQGEALLKDVRNNPNRTQDLTPAERQYLIKTLKK